MPPNGIEQVLFHAVLELPPEQRSAFLAESCPDEPALRARVAALLAAHEEAGEFLSSPTGSNELAVSPDEQPGQRIGRYKLLQSIGEGGFGTVWMAEQEAPVRRQVALKIIKRGMDTAQVVARFEAERQALALMDHPSIAKVFDGGETPAGQPFFVMELVRGVPITTFCDEQHLDSRQRLELFTRCATRCSTPTTRASSIVTSSPPTSWSRCTTSCRCPR